MRSERRTQMTDCRAVLRWRELKYIKRYFYLFNFLLFYLFHICVHLRSDVRGESWAIVAILTSVLSSNSELLWTWTNKYLLIVQDLGHIESDWHQIRTIVQILNYNLSL